MKPGLIAVGFIMILGGMVISGLTITQTIFLAGMGFLTVLLYKWLSK